MSVTLHTSHGDLKVELYATKAAENFAGLCASGYYDGTPFHRNIKAFMVQGGDPTGTGRGGKSLWGGEFADEFDAQHLHDARGTLSMANAGPDTNRSQFFITYGKAPQLNGAYSIFGRVIHGLETLDAMEKERVDAEDRPLQTISLFSATVHANPFAA